MAIILDTIRSRVNNQNLNFMTLVVGATGSGKSYACLRMGELLDSNFSQKNIVFSLSEFLDLLEDKNIKKGSVIVFEELGVNADARNYFDKLNKRITHILEIFRTRNLILLMNVPDQMFTDKKIRKLAHAIIDMSYIDTSRKKSFAKFKWIQNNPVINKTYYKAQRTITKGSYRVISAVSFSIPSKELRIAYEGKRELFLKDILAQTKKEIDASNKIKENEHLKKIPLEEVIPHRKKKLGISSAELRRRVTNDKGKITEATIKSCFGDDYGTSTTKYNAIKQYVILHCK